MIPSVIRSWSPYWRAIWPSLDTALDTPAPKPAARGAALCKFLWSSRSSGVVGVRVRETPCLAEIAFLSTLVKRLRLPRSDGLLVRRGVVALRDRGFAQ